MWDCDYLFEGDPLKINNPHTSSKSLGNANGNNVISIYARPDIGLTSSLPSIQPDLKIPNGAAFPDPLIDGNPNEAVWAGALHFDLGWDIETLRQNYPGVGKFMSGHYQPQIGGNPRPPILNPSLANVKMFFKDHYLYLAATIADGRVQGTEVYDEIDGLRVMIGHRTEINDDNMMVFKLMRVNFNASWYSNCL